MASTKEIARLEGRIDRLAEKIDYLTTRMDEHIDTIHSHESNHHGRSTEIKRGSASAIIAALVVAILEAVQRLI